MGSTIYIHYISSIKNIILACFHLVSIQILHSQLLLVREPSKHLIVTHLYLIYLLRGHLHVGVVVPFWITEVALSATVEGEGGTEYYDEDATEDNPEYQRHIQIISVRT